MRINLSKLETT